MPTLYGISFYGLSEYGDTSELPEGSYGAGPYGAGPYGSGFESTPPPEPIDTVPHSHSVVRERVTNWVPNPSFETGTAGWAFTNATTSRVTDVRFSGAYALQLVATTFGGGSMRMTDKIAVTAGQSVYGAIRTLARQDDAIARISFSFWDVLDEEVGTIENEFEIGLTTDAFEWTTLEYYMIVPDGVVGVTLFITFFTDSADSTGDIFLADAAELRINQSLDTYFDGDTINASWTGTHHASASIREIELFDFAQQHFSEDFSVAYRVWSVDDDLNDDEELTQWIGSGSITVNTEDDVKRTAKFDFDDLSVLNPFVTRLKVYMEKYIENILVANEPLGVFSIDMPDGTVEYEHRYGTVEASDIAIELADSARGKQFVYKKGKNIINEAEVRVRDGRGYKVNFPVGSKKFSKTEKFPQWTGDLELVNTLLEMAGFRGCYGDGNGIIVTQQIKQLSQTNPVVTIRPWEVFEIIETNNTDQLCNVVKVYKDNPDGAPIFAIVRNDDPADPVSTVNMRYKALVINDSDVDSNTEAQKLARSKLEEGKSFEKTLKITIVPNPYLGIYNVMDLYFDQADGTCYCGRYWIRGWELPLTADFMTVTLNRIQKFHDGLPDD